MNVEWRIRCSGKNDDWHRRHVYAKPSQESAERSAAAFNGDHEHRAPELVAYRECYPMVVEQRTIGPWRPIDFTESEADAELA